MVPVSLRASSYSTQTRSCRHTRLRWRHVRPRTVIFWGQPFIIENILDTLEAALASPPSKETRGKL